MRVLSPREIKEILFLKEDSLASIKQHRRDISNLISGADTRLAIIMGPCSLHNIDSAIEYATRVKNIQKQVDRTLLLVMRAHVEKPRTCLGWKGLLHDPHLNGQPDIAHGLFTCRQYLIELANLHIPLATEFLDPIASSYFSDLISWGFIGARTSSSQVHRQLASSLPMPIGFKNSIEGNLESAIHGVIAAEKPHSFLSINDKGYIEKTESPGNPHCHIVLRGSEKGSNYDPFSLESTMKLSKQNDIEGRILVDCSHGNCQKSYQRQEEAFFSIINQYLTGNKQILGSMLESHIQEGNQPFESRIKSPFLSLTDPCLSWETTERLILSAHESLSSSSLCESSFS